VNSIKEYIWFLKESQKFMKGTKHPIIIFFQSLVKGFGYVKSMNDWNRQEDKQMAYLKEDRVLVFKD